MENKFELNEKELEQIIGGMTNPVSNLTEEVVMKIVEQLGDGKDMGSCTTMSGEQFLQWWRSNRKEDVGGLVGGVCGNNSINGSDVYGYNVGNDIVQK